MSVKNLTFLFDLFPSNGLENTKPLNDVRPIYGPSKGPFNAETIRSNYHIEESTSLKTITIKHSKILFNWIFKKFTFPKPHDSLPTFYPNFNDFTNPCISPSPKHSILPFTLLGSRALQHDAVLTEHTKIHVQKKPFTFAKKLLNKPLKGVFKKYKDFYCLEVDLNLPIEEGTKKVFNAFVIPVVYLQEYKGSQLDQYLGSAFYFGIKQFVKIKLDSHEKYETIYALEVVSDSLEKLRDSINLSKQPSFGFHLIISGKKQKSPIPDFNANAKFRLNPALHFA